MTKYFCLQGDAIKNFSPSTWKKHNPGISAKHQDEAVSIP